MARRGSSGKGRGNKSSRSRTPTQRHYPRTARLNALLTEIVADYFELVEEPEFGFLTVTGVDVDSDLNVAQVFFSIFDDTGEDDDEVLDALADHRSRVQRAIASQAKLRKTPEVVFQFDPAVRAGARIDSILATIDDGAEQDGADQDEAEQDGADGDGAGDTPGSEQT